MILLNSKAEFEWSEFFQAPPPIDPHTKLASGFMNNWIEKNASSHGFDVSKNTPQKWEILGEIGLLSIDSFEPNFVRFLESLMNQSRWNFGTDYLHH